MGHRAPFFLCRGGKMLEEQIKQILEAFRTDTEGAPSPQELRNKYLGRKNGVVTLLMKELQRVPAAEKPAAGKQINELKLELESGLSRLEAGSGNTGPFGTAEIRACGRNATWKPPLGGAFSSTNPGAKRSRRDFQFHGLFHRRRP